MAINNNTITNK